VKAGVTKTPWGGEWRSGARPREYNHEKRKTGGYIKDRGGGPIKGKKPTPGSPKVQEKKQGGN